MSMQEAAMNARAAMNSLCTISRICRDLAHLDASAEDRFADLAALIRDVRRVRQAIENLRERAEALMADPRQGDPRPVAAVPWRSGDSRS